MRNCAEKDCPKMAIIYVDHNHWCVKHAPLAQLAEPLTIAEPKEAPMQPTLPIDTVPTQLREQVQQSINTTRQLLAAGRDGKTISCPNCGQQVLEAHITTHIMAECQEESIINTTNLDNHPISELAMAARVLAALQEHGLRNIGQLRQLTDKELLAIKGIGPKAVEEIRRFTTTETKEDPVQTNDTTHRVTCPCCGREADLNDEEFKLFTEFRHGFCRSCAKKRVWLYKDCGHIRILEEDQKAQLKSDAPGMAERRMLCPDCRKKVEKAIVPEENGSFHCSSTYGWISPKTGMRVHGCGKKVVTKEQVKERKISLCTTCFAEYQATKS